MSKTNVRFVKDLYPQFAQWLEENDFFVKRFGILADTLESRYINTDYRAENIGFVPLLEERSEGIKIVKVLPETYDCKNANFQKHETASVYAIWHFLSRYANFYMIYLHLLKMGILPVRYYVMNALDVATGPAPSMFALSDIYAGLKLYGRERNIRELLNIEFRPDYAEYSVGFRDWVHFFAECADSQSDRIARNSLDQEDVTSISHGWNVPYHKGSYYDIYETNFQKNPLWNRDKYGFRIVTVGNFIIPKDGKRITRYLDFLKGVVYGMKNGGIIVMVGRGDDYEENIKVITDCLLSSGMKKILVHDKNEK